MKGDIYIIPKFIEIFFLGSTASRLHSWGFPNKHNERMPQGSQGSSASQVHHHVFEGLYGYICWVFRGSIYQYQYRWSWKIPGYQHPQLQWTTSNAASSSPVSGVAAVGSAASHVGSVGPRHWWMDGWAGSRLKIEEKIPTFGAAKIADLIGMLFHMAGVQQKVFLKGSQ